MPKARNRKDHKKKSRARTQMLNLRKEKAHKEFVEMLQKAQAEHVEQQKSKASADTEQVVEGMDIGIDATIEPELGAEDGNIDINQSTQESK